MLKIVNQFHFHGVYLLTTCKQMSMTVLKDVQHYKVKCSLLFWPTCLLGSRKYFLLCLTFRGAHAAKNVKDFDIYNSFLFHEIASFYCQKISFVTNYLVGSRFFFHHWNMFGLVFDAITQNSIKDNQKVKKEKLWISFIHTQEFFFTISNSKRLSYD